MILQYGKYLSTLRIFIHPALNILIIVSDSRFNYFIKKVEMQSQTMEQKQKFLRSQIVDKELDAESFMQYMGRVKDQGDQIDLEKWTLKQLKDVVDQYREFIKKNRQDLMNSRLSKQLRKTKIFESIKKEKFKYEGTSLYDFEENCVQQCTKSQLAFQFSPNQQPMITIQKWQLKTVGGFIFGIGSRNELLLTIRTNFTKSAVVRKDEDCDWLKTILTSKHQGYYIPPLQAYRQFSSDDKKGISARINEINIFLNTLLKYKVFHYSEHLKKYLEMDSYKKFNQYKNQQTAISSQKDLLDIESVTGTFTVHTSQKNYQTLKKTSNVAQDLSSLYNQLQNGFHRLLSNMQNASRDLKYVNQIVAKIGEKYSEVKGVLNHEELKLPTIMLSINNSIGIILKNFRANIKALSQFNDNHLKQALREWNQFLVLDKRRSSELKSYLGFKESLLRKKQRYANQPSKWQLPETQFLRLQKLGFNKIPKEQIYDKMFPSDNDKENRNRIWLSYFNHNYLTSYRQFLTEQERSLLQGYLTYSEKYMSSTHEISESFNTFREIVTA